MLFQDRRDAGQQLAQALAIYKGGDAVVLALPRGGVAVGGEIAKELDLPLDVIITRKIGPPGNPEYAIAAVAENGALVINEDEIDYYQIPRAYLAEEIRRQEAEIARRVDLYRDGRPLPSLRGRTAIVVDDGVATGFTTSAALKAVRKEGPSRVILAVPVGPPDTIRWLASLADQVICLATPEPFFAVGRFYTDFSQVDDEEVRRLLAAAKQKERHAGEG